MKRRWKQLIAFCLCLCLVGGLFTACKAKGDSVLQVAWVIEEPEQVEGVGNMTAAEQERINAILTREGKPYQLEIKVMTPSLDTDWKEQWEGFDLVYGNAGYLSPEQLEETMVDLRKELEEGKLQSLYQSMPEAYWESLRVGEHIYNIARYTPIPIHGLWVKQDALEKLNLNVPEELIGQPLDKWGDFFAEVYEANDNQPFLVNPYMFKSDTSPVCQGNVWEAHFQMVTDHMGISYDEPEKGVQCVYESEYAAAMNQLWKQFYEKGYMFKSPLDYSAAIEKKSLYMRSTAVYNLEPVDTKSWRAYPLQPNGYSANISDKQGQSYVLMLQVLKNAADKDLAYQFLCDLAEQPQLAQEICEREFGFNVFTPAAQNLTPIGDVPTIALAEPYRTQLNEYYAVMQSCPAVGFVLDQSAIAEEQKAIYDIVYEAGRKDVITGTGVEINTWDDYQVALNRFVQMLREAGMDDVLAEANAQVTEYMGTNK